MVYLGTEASNRKTYVIFVIIDPENPKNCLHKKWEFRKKSGDVTHRYTYNSNTKYNQLKLRDPNPHSKNFLHK